MSAGSASLPTRFRDALVSAAGYAECHESVSRKGEIQPCEKPSVALRYDPDCGEPYPVCAYHSRADMVSLTHLRAALERRAVR